MREPFRTGLLTRQEVEERLRCSTRPISWVLAKVGGLLTVNLAHGWDAGNQFIDVAAVRIADLCGPGDLVAHAGGNQFAVVPASGSSTDAGRLAEALEQSLAQPIELSETVVVPRPVATVVTLTEEHLDPWGVAYRAHCEHSSLTSRAQLRAAYATAPNLAALAKLAAEGGRDIFAMAAIEVTLGDHTAVSGHPPSETAPLVVELDGPDGPVGSVRWWPQGGQHRADLNWPLANLIADELAMAASRLRDRHDAETDPLTGVWNRRGLDRRATTLTGVYAVALVDLDDLKHINDTRGHDAGDDVLCRLAAALRRGRHSDFVARWGGEEFVIVAPHTTTEALRARLERVLDELRTEGHGLTFSAGVAPGADDFAAAVEAADTAMYTAKHSGKARIVVVGTDHTGSESGR
jgi:diguanylate cyclase (GGDEF)-like protein